MVIKLNAQEKNIDFNKRYKYKSLKEFFKDIYWKMFSIKEVESIQGEFNAVLTELEKFKPRDTEYKNKKVKLLENVKSF